MRKTKLLIVSLIAAMTFGGTAYAAETDNGNQSLTLQTAIQKAVTYSPSLKNAETEKDKTDTLYTYAGQNVYSLPTDLSFNPSDTNTYVSLYSAEFNRRKAIQDYANTQNQVIADVKDAYFKIPAAQKDLAAAKVAKEAKQIALLNAQAKYKVGMIISAEVDAAEADVATADSALISANADVDSAYTSLDRLMGDSLTSRPVLVDTPSVEKKDIDVDMMMTRAAENSYQSWTATEAAKLNDKLKLFKKYYDIGSDTAAQSANTAQDTKTQIKSQTRQLCLSIDKLYASYNQTLSKIKQYQSSLKVMQAQWQAGMITRDNLVATQNALAQAEASQAEVAEAYNSALDTLDVLTGQLSDKYLSTTK